MSNEIFEDESSAFYQGNVSLTLFISIIAPILRKLIALWVETCASFLRQTT